MQQIWLIILVSRPFSPPKWELFKSYQGIFIISTALSNTNLMNPMRIWSTKISFFTKMLLKTVAISIVRNTGTSMIGLSLPLGIQSSQCMASNRRPPEFIDAEQIGTEAGYLSIRCRNCARCRQGDALETVSLREEQEQYLIDQSVTFNHKDGFLIAVLPFTSNPWGELRPNRYTAEKILDRFVN